MSLDDLRLVYVIGCFMLGLIILSPTLAMIINLPGGERFTELWILGPEHMAENYPFNIVSGQTYNISLGIANHMGCLEYYAVYVKLRSLNEPLPNSTTGTPSSLDPLFEYRVFLRDGGVWEQRPLPFSFEFSFGDGFCNVSRLILDGYVKGVNKTVLWDAENKGYYLMLFFELWIYNSGDSSFKYHNRFVSLWLNLTSYV
ncbi:MAG: DUF1616 domain-containing protein [Candidatus Bathyarchaeia archaeon]